MADTGPDPIDIGALHELLRASDTALDSAVARVRTLELAPTSRVKSTGTILEKLHRHIEVVALAAPTEDDLRRTHARYFLGLDDLAARMS